MAVCRVLVDVAGDVTLSGKLLTCAKCSPAQVDNVVALTNYLQLVGVVSRLLIAMPQLGHAAFIAAVWR